jgi:steroid 5-alpha reductase family enzyme
MASTRSIIAICVVYIAAGGLALALGCLLGTHHLILIAWLCDLLATMTVFLCSVGFNNTSIYDPYWSVAPVPIALYWSLASPANDTDIARRLTVLVLVALWAGRLTFNWIRRWQGPGHEDWRYASFRRLGRAYWPVSLLGFHLMPTAVVFLACLSLYPALALGGRSFGVLDGLAALVTMTAIWIEARADKQLHRFLCQDQRPEALLSSGLWNWSRHPNYFGEVLFWWGLYLFGLAADPAWWWVGVGPLVMTALFVFISIPMIERRMLARKPGYTGYRNRTSSLIPWFSGR